MSNQEKNLVKIVKFGVYFILIATPLFIWSSLIFPYITSKTLLFRIIIDLIAPFYFYLAWKFPAYRPKKSWLLYSWLIFAGVLLVSSIFGINFLKSFFGDLERMWGIFTILHFILFFVIMSGVFRTEKEWQGIFKAVVYTAGVVALYGLAQRFGVSFIIRTGLTRIESTLGNAAFVGGYFLLTIGVTIYLLYKKHLAQKKWDYLYLFLLLIQFVAFIFAGIRGAYLGFMAALVIFLLAIILKQKNKKLKLAYLSIFIGLVIIYGFLYFNRAQPWISQNTYLSRLTSVTDMKSNTVQTRFISWNAGLRGFKETPILGIGMENYNKYFDKYFNANLYNYSRAETWFDRAHNAVVEVLVSSGIIGLISYLAIFIILINYLFKIYKHDKENNFMPALVFFLIILAYFIQNIFVFDTLVVFMAFLICSVFINFLYQKTKEAPIAANQNSGKNSLTTISRGNSLLIILLIASIISGIWALIINFRIIAIAYYDTAFQYSVIKNKNFDQALVDANNIFYFGSYLDYINNKSANLMVDALLSNISSAKGSQSYSKIMSMAIAKLDRDTKKYPTETYSLVVLGRTLNSLTNYTTDNAAKQQDINQAIDYLNKAKILSPQRLQVYYLLAQNRMIANDKEAALAYMDQAINFNPNFPDNYWFKGITYLSFNDAVEGLKYINLALDKGYSVDSVDQTSMIANYAMSIKDYQTVVRLYEIIITMEPAKAENYVNLAYAYAAMGNKEEAIKYAQQAIALDPSMKTQAEEFIKSVEDGMFKIGN